VSAALGLTGTTFSMNAGDNAHVTCVGPSLSVANKTATALDLNCAPNPTTTTTTPPAVGSVSVDSSSPPLVKVGGTGTAPVARTATFKPPGSSLLVALGSNNNAWAGADTSWQSVSGGGLSWTRQVRKSLSGGSTGGAGVDGGAEVWTAPVGTAPGPMTVTAVGNAGQTGNNDEIALKVEVVTSTTGAPVVGSVAASSGTSGLPTVTVTAHTGSLVFAAESDWSDNSGPVGFGAGQTADATGSDSQYAWHDWQTSGPAAHGGSQIMSMTSPAGQVYDQAVLEVEAGGQVPAQQGTTTTSTSSSTTTTIAPTTTTTRPSTTTTVAPTTTTVGSTTTTTGVSGGSGGGAALPLSIAGTQFVNSNGTAIHLRGVDRSGTEYACIQGWGIFDGPSDAASIQAIKSWNVNVVRIPLNEDCWLNINGVKAGLGGQAYIDAIVNYVNLLNANGLYAILDLHWTEYGTGQATGQQPMPDMDHSPAFWSSVAATFKNNHAVLFDLFNEPYEACGFTEWRDGCVVTQGSPGNQWSYQGAGMQTLVNAVRQAGATQPILLGGLYYANDPQAFLNAKPTDPVNQLAISIHLYDWNYPCGDISCYSNGGPQDVTHAGVPVVFGEYGESDTTGNFDSAVLTGADSHGWSYLAWTWDTWGCSGTVIISDYTGTPCQSNGTVIRQHYLNHTGP
jgi:hypothetical protein